MADIDLIPDSYRQQYQFKKWFKRYAAFVITASLCLVAVYIALLFKTTVLKDNLEDLQLKNNIAMNKKQQYQQQFQERKQLQQQLDLLNGLRSGISIQNIFMAMDRVFKNDNIWFTHWKYSRSENRIINNDSTVDSVYFLVVSDIEKKQPEKWRIISRLNINGAALNHATLSDFIRRLIEQPEIQNVRIVRTEQFIHNQHKLIRFIIDVSVNTVAVHRQ